MKLLGFDFGNAVPKKEEPLFEIFQDGEGKFSAQHKSGEWLWVDGYGDTSFMPYHYRQRFKSVEACNSACEAFVKQREHKHVGTIKFIKD